MTDTSIMDLAASAIAELEGIDALMYAPEFRAWPKIARMNRPMLISEKVDGTNAAVIISDEVPFGYGAGEFVGSGTIVNLDEATDGWRPVYVSAQSRTRVITPGKNTDNHGFARWVADNAEQLAHALDVGYHFGEWYGKGINRGYGLDEKRFMLFNIERHAAAVALDLFPSNVEVATILYEGPFDTDEANSWVRYLRDHGSQHVPGFTNPEGIVVFHKQGHLSFKATCVADEKPKGSSDAA